MLNIPCPWCGPRGDHEFVNGGEAGVIRPKDPASAEDARWAAYLYHRSNDRGAVSERWLHRFGCGQWFIVERDARTHEILKSEPLRSPASSAGA